MAAQKPYATFKGDEFRNLIRLYSNHRMQIDAPYKRAVHSAIAQRRQAQKQRMGV